MCFLKLTYKMAHFRLLDWVRLLTLLSVSFAQDCTDTSNCQCPLNPTTSTPCSADHMFLNSQNMPVPAGQCSSNGKCVCASIFTGSACETLVSASATDVLMSSWAFLAKTCWSANAEGIMDVSVKYTPWNCTPALGCRPQQNFSHSNLPQIMFYSSFDNSFSQDLLQSYKANSNIATAATATDGSNPPCFGNSAVFKETISCSSIVPDTVL